MGETSWRPGNETALQGGHPCRQGKETAAKIATATIFARDRQSAIDLLKLLRSAQQSRYCRSHAFAQMGTARFIIAI